MLTHQRIPLQLAKSALSCWMYQTAQITLFPTPNHLWVPQSDHSVNTVKQASRPQVILQTLPTICLDYRAQNNPSLNKLYKNNCFFRSSFLVNFVVVIWAHARFPLNVCVCSKGQKHGLRTPKNLKLLGSERHFGLKFFEALGVFWAGLSALILVK